jgi:hypothetical protein
MPTVAEIAQWMLNQVEEGRLPQDRAARNIRAEFGEEFVYKNENRNWAIRKDILKEFKKISGDDVIWERGDREWRKQRPNDKQGRQQE